MIEKKTLNLLFSNLFDTKINWISCLCLCRNIYFALEFDINFWFLLLLSSLVYLYANCSCKYFMRFLRFFYRIIYNNQFYSSYKTAPVKYFRLKMQCEKSLVNYLPTWYSLFIPPSKSPMYTHIVVTIPSQCMHIVKNNIMNQLFTVENLCVRWRRKFKM